MILSRLLLATVLALDPVTTLAADAPDAPTFPDVGLYSIREGDLLGLIDRKGRVVLAPEFEDLKLGDGLIVARKGYRTAYFDRTGAMVIRPQDKVSQPFAEGLVPIPSGKGMGYADKSLNVVIEGPFAQAQPFSTGMAAVAVPDDWGVPKVGYIDKTGKLVIAARFDKAGPFVDGVARVEEKGRPRLIDRTGKDLTPADVDFVDLHVWPVFNVADSAIVVGAVVSCSAFTLQVSKG